MSFSLVVWGSGMNEKPQGWVGAGAGGVIRFVG